MASELHRVGPSIGQSEQSGPVFFDPAMANASAILSLLLIHLVENFTGGIGGPRQKAKTVPASADWYPPREVVSGLHTERQSGRISCLSM
jgi:hypothetical protein